MGAIALALGLGLHYSKVQCSPTVCNGDHEVCEKTTFSYECKCDKGYVRTRDGGNCANIDECNEQDDSELYKCNKKNTKVPHCIDNEGGYSCVCRDLFNATDFCNSCMQSHYERQVNETYSECVDECAFGICNMGYTDSCNATSTNYECECIQGGDYDDNCSKYNQCKLNIL